jgi:hypothetical protein
MQQLANGTQNFNATQLRGPMAGESSVVEPRTRPVHPVSPSAGCASEDPLQDGLSNIRRRFYRRQGVLQSLDHVIARKS